MSTWNKFNPLTQTQSANQAQQTDTSIYQYNQTRWQQAATRQNDLFNRHQLKIVATIKWQKRSDSETYQFDNIRIASQVDIPYELNLLQPQFSQIMACGWYCEYLNQPITQSVLGHYTMLDKLYENQQPALLNFYDSLSRLNQRLLSLKPDYQLLLPELIGQLAAIPIQFDSLSDAIGFINDHFDDIDFQAEFAQHPANHTTLAQPTPTEQSTPTELTAPTEQSGVVIATLNLPDPLNSEHSEDPDPDRALLASFQAAPSMTEMLQSPTVDSARPLPLPARYQQSPPIPNKPAPQTIENDSLWPALRLQPLNIGLFVCSYQDNHFGQISAIDNEKVTVKLKGQAMTLKDGLLSTVSPGTLFLTEAEFTYISSAALKTFHQQQVAPCQLNGF